MSFIIIVNVLEEFSNELIQFLTGKPKHGRSLLVKKHSENLRLRGDFSFPNCLKSWHDYLICSSEDSNKSLLDYAHKELVDLIEASKSWHLEIVKSAEDQDRIHIFLNRPRCITIGLDAAVNNIKVLATKFEHLSEQIYCDNTNQDSGCLTSLRLRYLLRSVQNLCSICAASNWPSVVLTARSSFIREGCKTMLCGSVLNVNTGCKETNIKADDYIRIRQNEMTLIAQHKYGVRVSTDAKWKEFVAHLGESAVKFELLQTKPSSAVKINFTCSATGSSKGASFIMYNCARLEAIIRTYNDKVSIGEYPPLPPLDETDFSLLTQEDEWCLVFNFIMGLPLLLDNCVEISDTTCDFRPHHVCSFLSSMVRVFSQYYRKTRILTEPRKHLLPVLFARLHLLKILNDILKTCLNILDIKSVTQMYFTFYYLLHKLL